VTVEDLIDEWRRRVFDTVAPYLWSDTEALIYANKAHTDFVRLIGGHRDRTSEVTDLVVPTGATEVDFDPRILKVVSARDTADSRPIDLVGPTHDLARAVVRSGRLLALVTGEDEYTLRPVNVPDVDYTLKLVVDRLPLEPLTDTSTLEVREENALDLVFGMMAYAYGKQDAETRNDEKATAAGAEFRRLAAAAFLEKRRRMGSNRTVAYGGI
jgi:hypothetical protein